MNRTARLVLAFIAVLILIGVVGVAVKGTHALTGLYVGAGLSLLLLVPFFRAKAGHAGARTLAFWMSIVFFVLVLGRAVPAWMKIANGSSDKVFAAVLISSMGAACALFAALFRARE
ncbi:MAG: hypothetical protein R3F20_17935 [Planctomycetota bacterium]